MDLHVSLAGRGDLSARIYRQLYEAIIDGRLRPGERLPPSRELAARLVVSRNTVSVAYERLTAEGFLVGRVGSGTFVCASPLAGTRPRASDGGDEIPVRDVWLGAESSVAEPGVRGVGRGVEESVAERRPNAEFDARVGMRGADGSVVGRLSEVRGVGGSVVGRLSGVGSDVDLGVRGADESVVGRLSEVEFDFRVGVPDVRRFPMAAWRRLVARELRELDPDAAGYGDPAGHAGLRAAIARHVGLSRSVLVEADGVLVTQGAQQALDLVGRVLVGAGDVVAVEEPGYPPARALFAAHGARVVGVPVDGEGLVVSAIPPSARLVYTTPSHQFPLGTAMSLERRGALLEWAHERRAVIVEDDYDSEFRYSERPLEPLHSLDGGRRVIYVGSFAKTMLPALRLGFLVVPASVRGAVRTAKRLIDRQGDVVTQGAMAAFLNEGLFGRHLRRATREYAARHQRIVTVLRRDFAERLDIVPSNAGLHLATRLRVPVGVDAVVARAAAAGVAVESLGGYYTGAGDPGLVLGYGAIDLDRVEPGLARLADCWS